MITLTTQRTDKLTHVHQKMVDGLYDHQIVAIEKILDWFFDNHVYPFLFCGYAGTGKTHCIQFLIKLLQSTQNIKIAVCAPTHRAVNVLSSKAHEQGIEVDSHTIQSLLHTQPRGMDENGNRKLIENYIPGKLHYTDYDLVIVDEASMISNDLLEIIERQPTRTIFMGDPAQLPPVGEEVSPIFQSPIDIELTTVIRNSGEINRYCTEIREDIESPILPIAKTGNNISVCNEIEWQREMLNQFGIHFENQTKIKVIAWTNARVNEINRRIRKVIKNADESTPYIIGERLIAKESIITHRYGSEIPIILMNSCGECVVQDVIEDSKKVGEISLKTYQLEIQDEIGETHTITTIHPSEFPRVQKLIDCIMDDIFNTERHDRASKWRKFYKVLDNYNLVRYSNGKLGYRLNYAYATTCHQAQGGTYGNVFVDKENILMCRDVKRRNQLLYVACSRASKHLYIND